MICSKRKVFDNLDCNKARLYFAISFYQDMKILCKKFYDNNNNNVFKRGRVTNDYKIQKIFV